MWLVSLFPFIRFLRECFVLLTCVSFWLIMDFNPLTYICCSCFLQPITCLLSLLLVSHKVLTMENPREIISDFHSRKSWASSQELVWGFPPTSPRNCVSLFSLWLQGSSEQTFLFISSSSQNLPAGIRSPDLILEFTFFSLLMISLSFS